MFTGIARNRSPGYGRAMQFLVNYRRNGEPCGHPDRAKTILEARLLAPEGRLLYGADVSIIVSVDNDGNEKFIEKIKI